MRSRFTHLGEHATANRDSILRSLATKFAVALDATTRRRPLSCAAVFLLSCAGAWAAVHVPEEPVDVVVRTTDNERVAGSLTRMDPEGFDVEDAHGESERVTWDRFSARSVFLIHQRVLDRHDAENWFDLGELLLPWEEGRSWSQKAFHRAVQADGSLRPHVEATIAAYDASLREEAEAAELERFAEAQRDPNAWPELNVQQMQYAVAEAKQYAQDKAMSINTGLRLFETDYYLLYSDLPSREAKHWARTLDSMYDRLCRVFAIPRGSNIYRGKALVFIFEKREDFVAFERNAFLFVPTLGTAGLCHQMDNGDVVISFYKQPNKRDFTAVLIHESAHGFLHRYRSPRHVVTWANEGLAEWVSRQFGPRSPHEFRKQTGAVKMMRKYKTMGSGFFNSGKISWRQYGIAADLTEFMIKANKTGYAAFINGIKDGLPWEQSLQENYGLTVDQLVDAFGRSMGIRSLRR